jgi:hypothetical protein
MRPVGKMIALTERAVLALDELVLKSELPAGVGIKLVAAGNEIGLTVGAVERGDQVVQKGGETLLIVDRAVAEATRAEPIALDCEIDVTDGQAKAEFHFLRAGS